MAGEPGDVRPGDDADAVIDDDLRLLLADPSTWAEPPASLSDGVVAAVTAEREAIKGSQPTPAQRATSPHAPSPLAVRRRGWRERVGPFVAGAAAAAVVAVGALVVSRGAPGGTKVALAGTELAPGAHGTARVTRHESGVEIALDASGLARRDGQLYYQAWLKGTAGLVPIGTFHTGDHVVLWAGVAIEDFPTITVTEEEVGDQESSGRRVLTGTVTP